MHQTEGLRFEYDYFKATPNNNTPNELRLCLLSLSEYFPNLATGVTTNPEKRYTFNYSSIGLPPKNSKGIDHWGFYNGENYNQTTIPKIEYAGQILGAAERAPDINKSKAGILSRVTYPTGGFSEYTF